MRAGGDHSSDRKELRLQAPHSQIVSDQTGDSVNFLFSMPQQLISKGVLALGLEFLPRGWCLVKTDTLKHMLDLPPLLSHMCTGLVTVFLGLSFPICKMTCLTGFIMLL